MGIKMIQWPLTPQRPVREACFLWTATKHPHKNRLSVTFMEEAWVSNSKMYILHGSVKYWILIGDFAVRYFCVMITELYN